MPTILLADDNLDLRDILSELLQAKGYDVLLAHDGEHAWELLQSNQPDIVLSDIDMPRLDGLSLGMRIKNSYRTANIPVVLVTGKPPINSPSYVFDVICKPVKFTELLETLNLALLAAGKSG